MRPVRATLRIEDLGRLVEAVSGASDGIASEGGAASGGAVLYAPRAGREGVELAPVAAGEAGSIRLDAAGPAGPVKSLFLPQREVLLSYQGDRLRAVHEPRERLVLFGVRPCDARALADLDRVFGDPEGRFQDPYYLRRREASLIVSLACSAPDPACFCTAVGGHPAGREGSDVLAFRLEERLLLEAVTARGEAFLAAHAALLGPAAAADGAAADARAREAEARLPAALAAGPQELREKLERSLEHPIWEEAARTCLGCGACAYLCPTCHCFDLTDETDGRGCGIRLRTWDCCQYPLFTLHASGHNPRDSRRQRMRQRIMHKFSYTLTNQGAQFCVGCGRCVRACPVNLDLRGLLDRLAAL